MIVRRLINGQSTLLNESSRTIKLSALFDGGMIYIIDTDTRHLDAYPRYQHMRSYGTPQSWSDVHFHAKLCYLPTRWRRTDNLEWREVLVVDSFRLFHIERKFLVGGKNKRATSVIRFSFLEQQIIKWKDSNGKNQMCDKLKKDFLVGLIVQRQVMIKHFFVLFYRRVGFGIIPRQRYLAERERILPIDNLSVDSLYTSSSSNMSRVDSIFHEDNSSLHEHHLVEHINSGSDHPMDCYLILSIRASMTCPSSTESAFSLPSSSRFSLPSSYGKFFRQFDSKYRRFNCVRSPKRTS